jgi:hypothetical protein
MKAANHKPTKRRNLTRWMESRLRRIDAKLSIGQMDAFDRGVQSLYKDASPESFTRCRDRGHRLASDIQYAWAKVNAAKLRATLNPVSP